jgi:hypothetical protein
MHSLVHAQLGESDLACENELVQSSATFNRACCPTAAACEDGYPSSCGADCAQEFMPFYGRCSSFVAASLPELVKFGTACQSAGVTVAPSPPHAFNSAGAQYVSATVQIQPGAAPSAGKKMKRYQQNFRQDVADALSLRQSNIIIGTISSNSVTFDVFVTSASEAQAIQTKIQQQISDPKSILMEGFVTDTILPHQQAQIEVHSASSGGGGGGGGVATGTTGQFHVTADNSYEAYVNGVQIGSGNNWQSTGTHQFDAPCNPGQIYAIHGTDAGGPAAIIASVDHCGGTSNTRCVPSASTSNGPP